MKEITDRTIIRRQIDQIISKYSMFYDAFTIITDDPILILINTQPKFLLSLSEDDLYYIPLPMIGGLSVHKVDVEGIGIIPFLDVLYSTICVYPLFLRDGKIIPRYAIEELDQDTDWMGECLARWRYIHRILPEIPFGDIIIQDPYSLNVIMRIKNHITPIEELADFFTEDDSQFLGAIDIRNTNMDTITEYAHKFLEKAIKKETES